MAPLICALPGSGKTWLVHHHPKLFTDGDALLYAATSCDTSDAARKLRNEPLLQVALRRLYARASTQSYVLTNLDERYTGIASILNVGYKPDDYIAHLRLVRRTDLLTKIGEYELRRWAAYLNTTPHYVQLRSHQHLASILPLLKKG